MIDWLNGWPDFFFSLHKEGEKEVSNGQEGVLAIALESSRKGLRRWDKRGRYFFAIEEEHIPNLWLI